jgi:signal transduction histidine kinase
MLRQGCEDAGQVAINVICDDRPCIVSGDPTQLRQVFTNLVKNALEAMKGEGTLSVTVAQSAGPVVVRFDDEGPGIPPDKVARVFEPFYTTREDGVGMGLAVSLRIITAHDGTIQAGSREGGGTTITVRLPSASQKE